MKKETNKRQPKSYKVGDRFKQARLDTGLSQEQFAERLHITKGAVSQWETNLAHPEYELLDKVCELTGRPADFFVRHNYALSTAPAPHFSADEQALIVAHRSLDAQRRIDLVVMAHALARRHAATSYATNSGNEFLAPLSLQVSESIPADVFSEMLRQAENPNVPELGNENAESDRQDPDQPGPSAGGQRRGGKRN